MTERRLGQMEEIACPGEAADVSHRGDELQVPHFKIHVMSLFHRDGDDKEFIS
jgi:hypothetical protein